MSQEPSSEQRVRYTEAGAALYRLLEDLEQDPTRDALKISRGRLALLRRLAVAGPQTVSEIARARGASRQGVQRLADALEKQGWAEYRPNPRHRRARQLSLTERGREAYRGLARREAEWLNGVAAGLPAGELARAARLVRDLRRLLSRTSAGSAAPGPPGPPMRSAVRSG